MIPRELGHVATVAHRRRPPEAGQLGRRAALVDRARGASCDAELDDRRRRAAPRRALGAHASSRSRCAPAVDSPWRPGGVYLITGGLGGIGMSIAQHIAKSSRRADAGARRAHARCRPKPSGTPSCAPSAPTRRVRQRIDAVLQLRTLGAEVVVAAADVTDEAGDRPRSSPTCAPATAGSSTVIHSAGILHDALIALRTPVPDSAVVDVKAKGALVLDRVLARTSARPVRAVLVGQLDHRPARARSTTPRPTRSSTPTRRRPTATARTRASSSTGTRGRRSAWRSRPPASSATRRRCRRRDARLGRRSCSTPSTTTTRSPRSPPASAASGSWLLDEHVVRGGEALIPGTGYLELARVGRRVRPARPGRSSCATSSSCRRSSSATARCAR